MKTPFIGIIGGKGKMGRYFADFFERNGYTVIISDRRTRLGNAALAKKADVVVVSVPIDKTEAVIRAVAPLVKKTGLLMDMTSLKAGPMEAMKKTRASYLGCHPLFGPTNPPEGQTVVLCQGRGGVWFGWFKKLLAANKIHVKTLAAKKHDELMAYVQVLSHFNDITLADALSKSGIAIHDFLAYQSPSYRLKLDMMGRILAQDPGLYGNIQVQNPYSQKALKQYLKSAETLAQLVETKNLKAFEIYFKKAARYLGDYKTQAMEASDNWIKTVIGSRSIEPNRPPKGDEEIAVLGPKNTYSDLALRSLDPKAKAYYATSITDVFEKVVAGAVPKGLVPIENSLTGSVRETLDELYAKDVCIRRIIRQPIRLSLAAARKIPLNQIEIIYSHPQALLQCRKFVRRYCPQAVTVPLTSTAAALERVKCEKMQAAAAIAAPIAAQAVGLKPIRHAIEDDSGNTTTFALITKTAGKSPVLESRRNNIAPGVKTAIAFNFSKDSPGSLQSVLQDFAAAGINLTKIESRPNPAMAGEYVFYLDFAGHPAQEHVKKTLAVVRGKVARMKLLGAY